MMSATWESMSMMPKELEGEILTLQVYKGFELDVEGTAFRHGELGGQGRDSRCGTREAGREQVDESG